MAISKTQIDRLGDRLKKGDHSDSDLRLLDEYRLSFAEASNSVVETLRRHAVTPSVRRAKSTMSIVEKLQREGTRLSRMQDIAGCRVVVTDLLAQESFVALCKTEFSSVTVKDRREKPSHGYRAVHVIVTLEGKLIEIQIRTILQHLWAEVSERSADAFGQEIKYGGGTQSWRNFLTKSSRSVARFEEFEKKHFEAFVANMAADAAHEDFKRAVATLEKGLTDPADPELEEFKRKLDKSEREMQRREANFQQMSARLDRLRKVNFNLLTNAMSHLDAKNARTR